MTRTRKRKRTRRPNKNARGPEGSIRGIPADEAGRVLEALVSHLKNVRTDLRRSEAACWLRERGYDDHKIDGFLWALFRLPGVRHGGRGELFFPEPPEAYARHRDWRMSAGRLDLADARAMGKALYALHDSDLTPSLARLRKRLMAATTPLLDARNYGDTEEGSTQAG